MRAVKFCTNKILQFLTGGDGKRRLTCIMAVKRWLLCVIKCQMYREWVMYCIDVQQHSLPLATKKKIQKLKAIGWCHTFCAADHLLPLYIIIGIPSLFHSRLKTSLFCKSFPPQPFLFFFRTDYMYSPDCLLLLLSIPVFNFSVLHFLVVVSMR